MGFLKSLFGGSKSSTPAAHERKVSGKEYRIIDLLPQSFYLERIKTQYLMSEGHSRFVWTPHKYKAFLEQFMSETFVFDGEIGSMCIFNFFVEQDLTGEVAAFLHKETLSEAKNYE